VRYGRPVIRALVVVAILAAVAASGASAAAKSPCALVTAADATKALGAKVGKPKLQNLGEFVSCFYSAGLRSVTVQSRSISRSDFDKSAKANPGPVKHLAGIGSDAYSVGGGSTLLLWKNGTAVTLLAIGTPNALATEKALAAKVAARL